MGVVDPVMIREPARELQVAPLAAELILPQSDILEKIQDERKTIFPFSWNV